MQKSQPSNVDNHSVGRREIGYGEVRRVRGSYVDRQKPHDEATEGLKAKILQNIGRNFDILASSVPC